MRCSLTWMTVMTLGISVGLPLRIKLFHIYHSVKAHRTTCLEVCCFPDSETGETPWVEVRGWHFRTREVRAAELWKLPPQAFLRVQMGGLTFILGSCFQLDMKLGRYVLWAWDGGGSQCPGSFPDCHFLRLSPFTVSQQSSLWMLEASESLSLLLVTACLVFIIPLGRQRAVFGILIQWFDSGFLSGLAIVSKRLWPLVSSRSVSGLIIPIS